MANWWDKNLTDKQKFRLQEPKDPSLLDVISTVPNPVGDVASGLLAAQDVSKGNYGSAALNSLGLLPFVPSMAGIVSKDVAKSINMPVTLPKSDEFINAVRGTQNASITPEGLNMSLVRYQKPEQELSESVRTGVFYLPEGSQQAKYYKGKGVSGGNYGGTQTISGETLYKNPLLAKGGTGGKAPEEAYKQLVGKTQFNNMQSDLMNVISAKIRNPRIAADEAYMFLEKHAPEIADNAWNIVENSKQGNQLRYALQEAVIANEARKAGHDAILGYSKGRGDKGNFLSEVFDLRESHYPSPSGEFYMNPEFEGLLSK
jgi:hypothetical protein